MSQEQRVDLGMLNTFLSRNKAIDFRKIDLRYAFNVDTLSWIGFEDKKESLIKQVKMYQRLLWILPNDRDDLANKFLENGILSPIQIANASKEGFIQNNLTLFDGDSTLAEQIYTRATTLMSKATSLHQSHVQQPLEPSIDAVDIDLEKLNIFLEKNKAIDFRTI
jgi:hypothetical protein